MGVKGVQWTEKKKVKYNKNTVQVMELSEKNPQIKKHHLESWQFYKLVHKTVMLNFFLLA